MVAVLIMPEVDYPAMDHFEPSIRFMRKRKYLETHVAAGIRWLS